MKRLIAFVLMIAFLLTGCAKGKPKDMPQDIYDQGVILVNVIDDYFKGNATIEQIKSTKDDVTDYVLNKNTNDLSVNETIKTVEIGNCLTSISLALNDLEYGWAMDKNQKDSEKKFKDAYKKLKQTLNM